MSFTDGNRRKEADWVKMLGQQKMQTITKHLANPYPVPHVKSCYFPSHKKSIFCTHRSSISEMRYLANISFTILVC